MTWLRQKTASLPVRLLLVAVVAYAVYFSVLTLARYAAFEARALDMGNMNQAIWNTARGNWFHLTNQAGTVNRLSLHVEPILIPISWLYWIYSGPPTLLILQATVVALGAIPTFDLARRQLVSPWAALICAIVFLLNPALQAANWLEFHPLTLAPTFFLAAFACLVAGRTRWFVVFAVLAASCKEEMGLLVAMMGIYAMVALHRVRLGLLTALLATTWSFVAVLGIQTYFADGNIHWGRYGYLGETPGEMVTTMLTQPDVIFAQLRSAGTLQYIGELLLPTGFLGLLAPELLLLAGPSFAINLLADFPPMHQVHTLIYAAPIVPFVIIAAIYGLGRASRWLDPQHSFASVTIFAIVPMLVYALIGQGLYGYLPGGGHFRLFSVTEHDRRAQPVLDQIPLSARVSAQDRLNPHVSGRSSVYIFPRLEDADTVLLDVTGPAWPQHPADTYASVQELLAGDFGVGAADHGYLLLERGATDKTWSDTFFEVWQEPEWQELESLPAGAGERLHHIDFADKLRLVDYQVMADEHGELVVKLYWQALQPLDEDVQFYVAYLDREGNVLHDSSFYPPVSVMWYPTSAWEPEMTVRVETLPWTLEAPYFVLALGTYVAEAADTGSGWNANSSWRDGRRLAVTDMAPVFPLGEENTLVRLGGFQRTRGGDWRPVSGDMSSPERTLDVRFGPDILLEGVRLTEDNLAPGGNLPFTLYWRALGPIPFDYSLFAHLVDESGQKIAQLDWQPSDAISRLPMRSWIPGQPVVDSQTIELPPDLPNGAYRLLVGVYDWRSGERLPAISDDGATAVVADAAAVAEIVVR